MLALQWLYQGLYQMVWLSLRLLFALSKTARESALAQKLALAERSVDPSVWQGWLDQAQQTGGRRIWLFYCSSAGEYEQALPIMARLHARGQAYPVVLFHSNSGAAFALARRIPWPWQLTPPDTLTDWSALSSYLNPAALIIVRYELWPGCLHALSADMPVYRVNVGVQALAQLKRPGVQSWLNRYVEHVFFIEQPPESPSERANVPKTKRNIPFTVSGDSKYDRVLERREQEASVASHWSGWIRKMAGQRRICVLGSAWTADIEVMLQAWMSMSQQEQKAWLWVIAPHDVSEQHTKHVTEVLAGFGVKLDSGLWLWSQRAEEFAGERRAGKGLAGERPVTQGPGDKAQTSPQVLVVDRMGMLAELYAAADLAFVGGGMDRRVHNVLEPAVHAVPIAFGPRFTHSKEASLMVEQGLVSVVHGCGEAKGWLDRMASAKTRVTQGEAIRAWLNAQAGASDTITECLLSWHV